MKILVLFAHPNLEKSNINRVLISGLNEIGNVTFHNLYAEYPDFKINVKYEQILMERHDCIVFHFPFYWYSTPAILKEWQDVVLERGWAYGVNGNALSGKWFFSIFSTGGQRVAYDRTEGNYTIKELIAPLIKMCTLCKLVALPPYVVHGAKLITQNEIINHQSRYHQLLRLITKNKLDLNAALQLEYFNDYFE